jgi:hypothetical protein
MMAERIAALPCGFRSFFLAVSVTDFFRESFAGMVSAGKRN